jgi:hypothetical protein
MKIMMLAILGFCTVHTAVAQQASKPTVLAPDKYDEWGDVPFPNERTHLDKIAYQLKEWPLSVVYLVIHAGKKSCKGEAQARGVRASDYLLKQHIEPERIVWIDAGWRRDMTIDVWIWPRQLGRPSSSTDKDLKRSEVTIVGNCKNKYRSASE